MRSFVRFCVCGTFLRSFVRAFGGPDGRSLSEAVVRRTTTFVRAHFANSGERPWFRLTDERQRKRVSFLLCCMLYKKFNSSPIVHFSPSPFCFCYWTSLSLLLVLSRCATQRHPIVAYDDRRFRHHVHHQLPCPRLYVPLFLTPTDRHVGRVGDMFFSSSPFSPSLPLTPSLPLSISLRGCAFSPALPKTK